MNQTNPLSSRRFYKVKKPKNTFICALCSAERQTKYSKNLSFHNYLQIVLVSVTLSWLLFNIIGPKSIFAIFLVWPAFDIANKLLYRKEIPCPHCGFDATWYRRDVNVANQKVKDFWQTNYPELVKSSEEIPNVENIPNTVSQGTEAAEASSHL